MAGPESDSPKPKPDAAKSAAPGGGDATRYVGTPAVGTSKAAAAGGLATVGPEPSEINSKRRRLVWVTGSILPSVVLHAVFDALVIPVQYGLIGHVPTTRVLDTGVDASFRIEVAISLIAGIAAALAFRRLAVVATRRRSTTT